MNNYNTSHHYQPGGNAKSGSPLGMSFINLAKAKVEDLFDSGIFLNPSV